MFCSIVTIIIGIVALAKGELKITSNRVVSDTAGRILAIVLIVGSILGGLTGGGITLITFVLVIIVGLFLMEAPKNYKSKMDDIHNSTNPYSSQIKGTSATFEPDLYRSEFNNTQQQYDYNPPNSNLYGTNNSISSPTKTTENSDTRPIYSSYVVYNMRTTFSKKPEQPTRCPKCEGTLKTTSIKPSQSVRIDLYTPALLTNHRYSYLFTCSKCNWWSIRENWKSNKQMNYVFDFLVGGVIPTTSSSSLLFDANSNGKNPQPWKDALVDPDLYNQPVDMPDDLVKIFPLK